jgi:taurine dioxygenase
MSYRHIEVRPVAGALGAEIHGVDLSGPVGADTIAEIRKAFLEHLVIFFRGQKLAPQRQLEVAGWFGAPMAYPQLKGLPECPMVTAVIKRENERVNFGGVWHSDTTYLERPPMGSMLYAVTIPPFGGDTMWANQYLAYETLSDGLKKSLDGMVAHNTSTKAEVSKTREDRLKEAGVELKPLLGRHPVVRTHPETGRKALFVNCAHTSHFEGWTEAESTPLLQYLYAHQVKPEFTVRFRWEVGSIAFWDNRCAQHNPINDYHGYLRVMHRVTLEGDVPA